MKVVYWLPVKEGVMIPIKEELQSKTIDDIRVELVLTEPKNLAGINLVIEGYPLNINSNDIIIPTDPKLKERIFRLATYISNLIFIQTALDALMPDMVVDSPPQIFPETTEEEMKFEQYHHQLIGVSIKTSYNILGSFKFQEFPDFYIHKDAFIFYGDGLKVSSPFIKYEQFYKVVEYFFDNGEKDFDGRVSQYACLFDDKFDSKLIRQLRELRNRSVHPRADKGHVNPSELVAIKEVTSMLNTLQKLARLLLDNPPNESLVRKTI